MRLRRQLLLGALLLVGGGALLGGAAAVATGTPIGIVIGAILLLVGLTLMAAARKALP